ncbi:MAG: hypothetical protein U0M96_08615 [Eggerthellaceae bacterium]
MQTETISDLLRQANASIKEQRPEEACRQACKVLEVSPSNREALMVLAKVKGWDSIQCILDARQAAEAAAVALEASDENMRHKYATEIYAARKNQLAQSLETALMMTPYAGSKRIHEIMLGWLFLLQRIPYLNADLLLSEINLCTNLCERSKQGIMPNDRMIYTAYATFNKKERYDITFRNTLQKTLNKETIARQTAHNEAKLRFSKTKELIWAFSENPNTELADSIKADKRFIKDQLQIIEGHANRDSYLGQIKELNEQLQSTKPFKITRRRQINNQIAQAQDKLSSIDAELSEIHTSFALMIEEINAALAKTE